MLSQKDPKSISIKNFYQPSLGFSKKLSKAWNIFLVLAIFLKFEKKSYKNRQKPKICSNFETSGSDLEELREGWFKFLIEVDSGLFEIAFHGRGPSYHVRQLYHSFAGY